MKLHYMGKFNLDSDSLPHGEHQPNAVPFKEAEDSKKLSKIANTFAFVIMVVLAAFVILRCREYLFNSQAQVLLGAIMPMLALFPHEILHAICFKEDVYLYTNLKQGMLFVIGTETMSKSRFVFMSLLPNIVFGIVPYVLGLIFPKAIFLAVFGVIATGMGAGDYYNVFNAVRQMPRGARTYLYGFHSYWYMPQ